MIVINGVDELYHSAPMVQLVAPHVYLQYGVVISVSGYGLALSGEMPGRVDR